MLTDETNVPSRHLVARGWLLSLLVGLAVVFFATDMRLHRRNPFSGQHTITRAIEDCANLPREPSPRLRTSSCGQKTSPNHGKAREVRRAAIASTCQKTRTKEATDVCKKEEGRKTVQEDGQGD